MIQIDNITKSYAEQTVLQIDQLSFNSGETVGIVGNNGAGKTTLFNLILDLIAADKGQIYLKEIANRPNEEWKSFTSAFIDDSFLIQFLTPDEYFEFIGGLNDWNPSDTRTFMSSFDDFYNDEIIGVKKYIRDLSKGNQKKLGLTSTFIGNPEIIIWDEPFSNLDPSSQIRLKNIINERKGNCTWLISSHDLNHIVETCDRIVILEKGVVVENLVNNEEAKVKLDGYFNVSK